MARRPDPEARGKLLLAARAAFASAGLDGARVETITRAAGLSKGAFYLHFESKEAAFTELVAAFFEVVGALSADRHAANLALRARVGGPTERDWRERTPRLAAFAELDHVHTVRMLEALWEHRDMLRVILEQVSGRQAPLVDQFVDLARASLTQQLDEAVEQCGVRDDLDRELVSDLLIGLYLQIGRRMIRCTERPDFAMWARTVNTLVVEGLAARADGVAEPLPAPLSSPLPVAPIPAAPSGAK